ncbi:glycosyltransferase [Ampullimonas aquatilis]|uniref:glycosyltransferase n=1 Tax=Ampullimonas aquatilis TaxID=1341549 RepID=UPI003C72B9D6
MTDAINKVTADKGCLILHCAEVVKGGTATYLRELLPLQRAAFGPGRIHVIVPESHADQLVVPDGVGVTIFKDSPKRAIRAFKLAAVVKQLVNELKPQIVHIHSTFAGATVRPFLALTSHRPKVIYCAHGWAFDRAMSSFGRWVVISVERSLAMLCDKIVCISNHDKKIAIEVGIRTDKLVVARNGIAREMPACSAPQPVWNSPGLRVLFIGRFDRQKGVDVFFAAMSTMQNEVTAFAIGAAVIDGTVLPATPPNITCPGWVKLENMPIYLEMADVIVVPSRWEGFGLIAVEAMRAGLAVIASRVGGLAEVVEEGVTGFLVEPDKPEEIVNILRTVTREQLHEMGNAGREHFLNEFTSDRLHRELCEVYGLPVSLNS